MGAAEVVAAYVAPWERGQPEEAWSLYADDVVMRRPGRGSLAGTHRGRDAVIAVFQALLERNRGLTTDIRVLYRLTSGERVALLMHEGARRDNESIDLRRVNVYRVVDDKIAEIDIFEANQYEVDEFFD